MKKILLVANVAKEHVLKFHIPTIKALIENGWQVDVACGGKEDIPYCHKKNELPIDRSPFKTHFVKAIRQLRIIIKNEKYDVVYCHTSVGATVARLAAYSFRRKGTKIVKFAHGTYFYKGAPIYNWLFYPLYKMLSWVTDAIITITQEDYKFSKRHFSHATIYYVPGIGVDPARFVVNNPIQVRIDYRKKLSIPSDAIVLIYTAELIKNKNQQMLMDALKLVLENNPNTYLLLVGPDHTNGEYEKYAKESGLWEHIRFLGWRKDIAELYIVSDICTASSIREGLGLNIIEAITCGLPVIATNNSGHRAIIENDVNGILVTPNDVENFAKKINLLIKEPQIRKKLADNAMQNVEKYYNENVLKQILKILNSQLTDKVSE